LDQWFNGPAAVVHWPTTGKAFRFESGATFVAVARYDEPPTKGERRLAVVGNGITEVGNQTASRNPSQPIAERLAGIDGSSEPRIDKPLQTGTISICGAMSLQGGGSGRGDESVPQKLVQLVGCRDPKVRPEPWGRPQSVPAKP
jgi:hypothetical protein